MMQGDSYSLPIEIKIKGKVADGNSFEDVEVVIGAIRKTMSDGQIVYDPEQKAFLFPLSQEDTYRMPPGLVSAQVRVKLANGFVLGTQASGIHVLDSLSEEVL